MNLFKYIYVYIYIRIMIVDLQIIIILKYIQKRLSGMVQDIYIYRRRCNIFTNWIAVFNDDSIFYKM